LSNRTVLNKTWSVYLLECFDNSLYCGVTNNLEHRLIKHNKRIASKYTRARLPVELTAVINNLTKSEAFKIEYRVKKLPASKKITALEDGNFLVNTLLND
jgi:putative endonuclease